nr:MAG TPA: hypothetical protein [Bacteriophage sp.]
MIPGWVCNSYTKNRNRIFPKFDLNFVQICPEKLMKNFNGLKCII